MPPKVKYAAKEDVFFENVKVWFPHAELFTSQRHDASAVLCLDEGRCRLALKGEVTPDQILTVFNQAKKAGHTSIGNGMLIDFTRFTGTIDWDYARSDASQAPGMSSQPEKIAYIAVGDQVMIIKALMVWLAKKYECKIFRRRAEAEAWLGWK